MDVSTARPSEQLSLAPHVRACHVDGQVILLDLRRNQYVGVGGRHMRALEEQVKDWPVMPVSSVADADAAATGALKQRLLTQGLLTSHPSKRRNDSAVEEATSTLDFEGVPTHSIVNARRIGRFLQSVAVTSLRLRFRSLHGIEKTLTARRARHQAALADGASREAVFSVAAVYDTLRPFALTARDKCLQDSLALIDFMASERLFPRWVIGVKTRPFAAHSWVQCGGAVLNDQHEHVRRFRPILVV